MNPLIQSQDFMDVRDSSSTNARSLTGQHNQQQFHNEQISQNKKLSQTLPWKHQQSHNFEHRLDNNSPSFSTNNSPSFSTNNNWVPDVSQDVSDLRKNDNEPKCMSSVSFCEPGRFLDENHNENRRDNSNSCGLNRDGFYDVQNTVWEKYGQCSKRVCVPSTNEKSNRPDERIHKPSIERQDSTNLDIELADCAPTQNTLSVGQASSGYKQGAPSDLGFFRNADENNLKPFLRGSHLDKCEKNCPNVAPELLQSHKRPCTWLSDNPFFNEEDRDKNTFPSGCPETYVGESTLTKKRQILPLLCKDCTHNFVDFLKTVPLKFEVELGRDGARQDADGLAKEGVKAWSWLPATKKDVALCVVILLLTFGIFHLHGRVDAVERSCTRGCFCVKDSEIRDVQDTSMRLLAGEGDVSGLAVGGLGNGQQETPTVDGDDSSNGLSGIFNYKNSDEKIRKPKILSNEQMKNIQDTQSFKSSFDGFQSMGTDEKMSLARTEGKNSTRNYLFQATLSVSSDGETHAVEEKTPGLRVPDTDIKVGGRWRSRRAAEAKSQSAVGKEAKSQSAVGKEVEDKKFAGCKRNQVKGNQKCTKGNKLKSNTETYEARFYELFPYASKFRSKDCSTRDGWDESIEGCKEQVVKLNHVHTVLPIYNATVETASKQPHTRFMTMSNDKPGQFKVNIGGDYLVHLNIYIVVDNPLHDNKHFLALYHNGQAKLACHQGGFRCPHTNREDSNKYKICNIIGVLELKKNDTVDIRTMHKNMQVRMENGRNTYFRVALLSQRQ